MAIEDVRQVNPFSCTPADLAHALQTIVQEIVLINETIEGGAVDNFTVYADATDSTDPGTPNFLHEKLLNQTTYDSETHQLVYADVVIDTGDSDIRKVRLFTAAAAESGTDDKKVLVSSSDSTAEYLHASIQDAATYVSGSDLLVTAQIVDNSGNERERFFVDVSAITDYSASGFLALVLSSGASQYATMPTFANALFTEITLDGLSWADNTLTVTGATDTFKVKVSGTDTTEGYLHESFTHTEVRDTNADPLVKFQRANLGANETETAFLDSSAITNGSSLGSGLWFLVVEDGVIKWVQAGGEGGPGSGMVTIKVPTTIELNLTATTLEVKLNYTEYSVFGSASGTPGSTSDTVGVDDCIP